MLRIDKKEDPKIFEPPEYTIIGLDSEDNIITASANEGMGGDHETNPSPLW